MFGPGLQTGPIARTALQVRRGGGFALPTVASSTDDRDNAIAKSRPRVAGTASLYDLDELMFSSSGWFVIGTDNQPVKGVRVSSLEAGLSLVGEGAVATVVGRLRPEVRVVDVDLEGERGHVAAAEIAAWCRSRDLWCLLRPSGGADGRAHVFVVPGQADAELAEFVEQLRTRMRTSARAIDLRTSGHVRPLSSPHRHGGHTRPHGILRDQLRALLRHGWATAAATSPAGGTPRSQTQRGSTAALTPRPRRRTDLPAQWVTYLRTGAAPPHGGEDHSRSTDELLATVAMLRAGHTAETAWALITAAHPKAMVRARSSRRRWIAWVWNRAVEDDRAHSPAPKLDPDVAAALSAAQACLTNLMWATPPRQRKALLLVGHHVLDRMARANSRRVPVPERDLVKDTSLTDRKTIRSVLRRLNGPLGVLHTETWDPARKDNSSYEFEIPAPSGEGVRQIPPPSLHTPNGLPRYAPASPPPRGTWSQLPGHAHALWRTLLTTDRSLSPGELAALSGITEGPDQAPSPSQVRTTTTALTALAHAGLADCAADGTWIVRHAPSTELVERAATRYREIEEAVEAERAAYRAPGATWNLARARALKAQLSKERAWWGSLPSGEQAERRATWRGRFDQLSVLEQERVKATLARRRINAGVDERSRHDAWVDAMPAEEYVARAIERQRKYDALPPPLRQAHVAAWQRHRDKFGITRATMSGATRREHSELLPRGPAERDAAFLDEQLRVVEGAIEATA